MPYTTWSTATNLNKSELLNWDIFVLILYNLKHYILVQNGEFNH